MFNSSLSFSILFCCTILGWLGAASWSTSLFSASIVVALCRRKSTRLTAVLGGLVLALGILFTSFATQLHQIAFSYGKFERIFQLVWFFYVCLTVIRINMNKKCSQICLLLYFLSFDFFPFFFARFSLVNKLAYLH